MQVSDFVPPILLKFGRRIKHTLRSAPSATGRSTEELLRSIDAEPTNPNHHLELAEAYRASPDRIQRIRACASYRTAMLLGADPEETARKIEDIGLTRNPDGWLAGWDHNQAYRFKTISETIVRLCGASPSVLDVGGGDGTLCIHLPDSQYALCEPGVNGIDGRKLPFEDNRFDVVCACHVLEHIAFEDRNKFLDNLCAKASQYVVLLNPFMIEGSDADNRLRLLVDITDADWAHEHVECGLPDVDEVRRYASQHGYPIEVVPNGSVFNSFCHVLANHYANLAGRADEMKKVNTYLNQFTVEGITNERFPIGYLIVLDVRNTG